MAAASHRGVDGPVVTGPLANAFMGDRDDDIANPLLQADRERLNELNAELAEPSANAMPVTPVRAGRQPRVTALHCVRVCCAVYV